MASIIDVITIVLLFTAFGLLHSFLAANNFKKYLINKIGKQIAFYRLIYVGISLVTLYLIYTYAPKPDIIIYDLPKPFDIIILVFQFLCLAGFFWTLRYFCVREFIGFNQIKRWLSGVYNTNELDEELTLRIQGPYKYTRHPLYLFSILVLALRPEMNLFYLTFLICIITYFYIGSIYEEKKLIQRFGNDYTAYQNSVPRIIPKNLFNAYNSDEITG